MNNNTSSQKKYIIDFATILTISGILLYYLGWMYWERFFLTLSVKPSLIDIPFDKIILTTWYLLVILLISFIFTFQQFYEDKKQNQFEVVDLAWLLLIPIYINISSKIENYYWYILVSSLILYALIKILQNYKKLPKKFLSKQHSLIAILVAIYIFGIYFYREKGEREALTLKRNYCEDITLKLKDGSNKYGKFIIFMNNKYFLLIEDENCKIETFIINDGEVIETKFTD